MTRASSFILAGLVGVATGACSLDTSLTSWSVDVEAPTDDAGKMSFCPSIMKSQAAYVDGTPALRADRMTAPTGAFASVTIQNEDIFSVVPSFTDPVANAVFGVEPMVFDIGPIGTMYTAAPESRFALVPDINDVAGLTLLTTIVGANGQPASEVNVTRTFLDGQTVDSRTGRLRYEYAFDCSEITVQAANDASNTASCACDPQTVTWRLTGN
ncbi:MAG: hypothetical protein FJ137_18000 [Deltaproteobacteria bacterium]|nr:hypothetical protein [Deltaproteobacteria bacterium]